MSTCVVLRPSVVRARGRPTGTPKSCRVPFSQRHDRACSAGSGRHGIPEDILGIIGVSHAQGDAQVRVRTKVVLDDARRALGRQDEVQAEGTSSLGDVDDAVNELRYLTCQGRELINHNNQRRRHSGSPDFFQLSQVFFCPFR